MLKSITDLGYRRNFLEALEFYIFYTILGYVLLSIISWFISVIFSPTPQVMSIVGKLSQTVYCLLIVVLVLERKRQFKRITEHHRSLLFYKISYIGIVIVLSYLGLWGGMTMISFLTMKKHIEQLAHENG